MAIKFSALLIVESHDPQDAGASTDRASAHLKHSEIRVYRHS
jgi:hypothetical protein